MFCRWYAFSMPSLWGCRTEGTTTKADQLWHVRDPRFMQEKPVLLDSHMVYVLELFLIFCENKQPSYLTHY